MSVLFGGPKKPTRINHVQINQSVLGYPLPVVMGKAKIQQSLLWVDGMSAKAVTPGGGKGLGGGKGGTSYLYSADVIAALCNGPVTGIGDVWSGQSWLSNSTTSESYTIAGSAPSYTPANASSGVFVDSGVSVSNAYSNTNSDLGGGGPVTLSGTDSASLKRVPYGTSLTTGLYSIDSGNKYYFSTADVGKTVQINYAFALNLIKQQENDLVPTSKNIQVGGTFQFHEDDGVTYYTGPNNGQALTKVSGTPTVTGTYSVSGSGPATYHFAPGDVGHEVQITYKIQNNSAVPTGAPGKLTFSLFEGTKGQAVWSLLTSSYPQAALGYTSIAYVAYDPMTLGYAADIQQNVFEVVTADAYGGGVVDCNPVQCIQQVLTNPVWGLGAGAVPFPASAIDNGSSGTWGGAANTPGARSVGSSAWNWFAANSFFISPVIDHQDSAASIISKWLEAGQCAAFMSEGMLKLVPYGDTSTAGNGCTWTAPTTFAAAVDDTCFISKCAGKDPVKISSSPWQDAYNVVQVQWENRANQYAPEITPESDQAAINRYGSRIESPQSWDFIHTLPAATFAASMRVKRNVYTRNTYEFSLPYSYSYLECMDVLAVTTSSQWAAGLNNANLGVVNLPVRITKIVDNPDGKLDITAEDYPFGVHQPTLYNKGIGAGQTQVNLFEDPGNTEVVMFEATSRLTGFQGNQIWMGACGSSDHWGSCNVWVSQDNVTYKEVGSIDSMARLGVLASSLASGADPDTSDSLVVDLVTNSPALEAGTTTDADKDNTLCFVDGELISYSSCVVTGQEQYTMGSYLRRGRMGSTIGAHAAGTLFLRLDDSIFKFTYDPTWAGQTIYLKFQSVNSFGNSAQDLSTLTATSFTVPGLNPGTVEAGSGLVLAITPEMVGAGPLGWAHIAATSDGTINYGSVVSGSTALPSGVNPTYSYARWTGYIIPSVTGLYTVGVNSEDGVSLYLAGQPIVANLKNAQVANSSAAYTQSSKIQLTKGVPYPVVLEWQHGSAVAFECQLLWTPPGGSVQLIPSANLSTSQSSVTGNLAGTWWNGTTGLWFPSGSGLIDPANKTLYGPPNAGGGSNVVSSVVTSSVSESSPAVGNSFTIPGWIVGQVWSSGGQTILILPSLATNNQGYKIVLGMNSGSQQAYITTYVGASNGPDMATHYTPTNPAAVTGWWNFAVYVGANGYLAVWINGNLAADCTDNTYTPLNPAAVYYGLRFGGSFKLAPAPIAASAGSSGLNAQGSIVPIQPINSPSWTTTSSSIALSWASQTVGLSDGSSIVIAAGSKSYTGLGASTTYHIYPYVDIPTLTIMFANASPPPTSANSADSLAANADGTYSMTPLTITTVATGGGGGSGGGGGYCPESHELVDVQGKGLVPVGDVEGGDYIKGYSFKTKADVYRKVVSVASASCAAWRVIRGHKVSPCEPVWVGSDCMPAYRAPGAAFDGSVGIKSQIHVNSDDYDECNFWLFGGSEPLLVHNQQPLS